MHGTEHSFHSITYVNVFLKFHTVSIFRYCQYILQTVCTDVSLLHFIILMYYLKSNNTVQGIECYKKQPNIVKMKNIDPLIFTSKLNVHVTNIRYNGTSGMPRTNDFIMFLLLPCLYLLVQLHMHVV